MQRSDEVVKVPDLVLAGLADLGYGQDMVAKAEKLLTTSEGKEKLRAYCYAIFPLHDQPIEVEDIVDMFRNNSEFPEFWLLDSRPVMDITHEFLMIQDPEEVYMFVTDTLEALSDGIDWSPQFIPLDMREKGHLEVPFDLQNKVAVMGQVFKCIEAFRRGPSAEFVKFVHRYSNSCGPPDFRYLLQRLAPHVPRGSNDGMVKKTCQDMLAGFLDKPWTWCERKFNVALQPEVARIWLEIVAQLAYGYKREDVIRKATNTLQAEVCNRATADFDMSVQAVMSSKAVVLEHAYFTCGAHAESFYGHAVSTAEETKKRLLSWMYFTGKNIGEDLIEALRGPTPYQLPPGVKRPPLVWLIEPKALPADWHIPAVLQHAIDTTPFDPADCVNAKRPVTPSDKGRAAAADGVSTGSGSRAKREAHVTIAEAADKPSGKGKKKGSSAHIDLSHSPEAAATATPAPKKQSATKQTTLNVTTGKATTGNGAKKRGVLDSYIPQHLDTHLVPKQTAALTTGAAGSTGGKRSTTDNTRNNMPPPVGGPVAKRPRTTSMSASTPKPASLVLTTDEDAPAEEIDSDSDSNSQHGVDHDSDDDLNLYNLQRQGDHNPGGAELFLDNDAYDFDLSDCQTGSLETAFMEGIVYCLSTFDFTKPPSPACQEGVMCAKFLAAMWIDTIQVHQLILLARPLNWFTWQESVELFNWDTLAETMQLSLWRVTTVMEETMEVQFVQRLITPRRYPQAVEWPVKQTCTVSRLAGQYVVPRTTLREALDKKSRFDPTLYNATHALPNDIRSQTSHTFGAPQPQSKSAVLGAANALLNSAQDRNSNHDHPGVKDRSSVGVIAYNTVPSTSSSLSSTTSNSATHNSYVRSPVKSGFDVGTPRPAPTSAGVLGAVSTPSLSFVADPLDAALYYTKSIEQQSLALDSQAFRLFQDPSRLALMTGNNPSALIQYKLQSLKIAAERLVHDRATALGGKRHNGMVWTLYIWRCGEELQTKLVFMQWEPFRLLQPGKSLYLSYLLPSTDGRQPPSIRTVSDIRVAMEHFDSAMAAFIGWQGSARDFCEELRDGVFDGFHPDYLQSEIHYVLTSLQDMSRNAVAGLPTIPIEKPSTYQVRFIEGLASIKNRATFENQVAWRIPNYTALGSSPLPLGNWQVETGQTPATPSGPNSQLDLGSPPVQSGNNTTSGSRRKQEEDQQVCMTDLRRHYGLKKHDGSDLSRCSSSCIRMHYAVAKNRLDRAAFVQQIEQFVRQTDVREALLTRVKDDNNLA